jgi:hypothetical protein
MQDSNFLSINQEGCPLGRLKGTYHSFFGVISESRQDNVVFYTIKPI